MSVVVRYPNGKAVLLVKGADTSMLPHIVQKTNIEDHLTDFAKQGLRTLVLAYRELDEDYYEDWHARYAAVSSSMSEDKSRCLSEMAIELEQGPGLQLLGATAIGDQLQDEVPETIERLRQQAIVVWVLTGDKMETAINIGRACKLLTASMSNIEIDGDAEEIRRRLTDAKETGNDEHEQALTITGAALAVVLSDDSMPDLFYRVTMDCRSVLCCRVTPAQKAEVVELVKTKHRLMTGDHPVTLSIGDGANDVSMITAAHVGVGLSGKEGAQAARAADFAISEFKFLRRLVFLHGRESYRRNAIVIAYNFYKNILLVLPPFVCGHLASFSGQPFYDQALYQAYNVIFTVLPIGLFGLLDRPAKLDDLEGHPKHAEGRKRELFNPWMFAAWSIAGLLQAIWISAVAWGVLADGSMSGHCTSGDLWTTGTAIYAWVVLGANLTLARRLTATFPFSVFVLWGSVVALPAAVFFQKNETFDSFVVLFGEASTRFVLATLLIIMGFLFIGEPLIFMSVNISSLCPARTVVPTVNTFRSSTSAHRKSFGMTSSYAMSKQCKSTLGKSN